MTSFTALQRSVAQLTREYRDDPEGFLPALLDELEKAHVLQDTYLVYKDDHGSA
jgi:hypothetical protein